MHATISKELLDDAVRRHGHLGPFLVLGLRMSLRAWEILGGKPTRCELETINRKPFLCALDGIRTVMGSDAVIVREGASLSAKFSQAKGREVTVKVKRTLIKKYAEGPWGRREEYAYEVIQTLDEQLYE